MCAENRLWLQKGNRLRNSGKLPIGYIHKMETSDKGFDRFTGKSRHGRVRDIQNAPVGTACHDHHSILLVED